MKTRIAVCLFFVCGLCAAQDSVPKNDKALAVSAKQALDTKISIELVEVPLKVVVK